MVCRWRQARSGGSPPINGCSCRGVPSPHEGDGLLDGDDAVAGVPGPQLVDRRDEGEGRTVAGMAVDGGVAGHVGHAVGAELLPGPVEVAGPAGRGRAPAAPGEVRPTRRQRGRGDLDAAAVEHERLTRDGVGQVPQVLLGHRPAPVEVDAVHLVLLGSVADGGDVADPSPADAVEDDRLLGQPDRPVQREVDHRHRDGRGLRPGRHGGRQDQGRWQVAVRPPVVLAHHGEDRTPGLGPGGRLQGRLVRSAVDAASVVPPWGEPMSKRMVHGDSPGDRAVRDGTGG